MEKVVHTKNFEQWSIVAKTYHDVRPTPPKAIIKIILSWLRKNPDIVVDVGCGTGLSTIVWKDVAEKIVGIEPNAKMRKEAEVNANCDRIVFIDGLANETNLPADYADIITVSQAFHWMDIDSSLLEFYQVLKKGGILAIYDFELPPIFDWEGEKAFLQLRKKCSEVYYDQVNPPVQNDKATYYERIKEFGKFRHLREVPCYGVEKYSLARLLGFLLNISNAPFAMEHDCTIENDIDQLFELIRTRCSEEVEIIFPYTMVMAVK